MFIEALFATAKYWELPKDLSTGEEINKLCCVHTMEKYLAIKEQTNTAHNNLDKPQKQALNERHIKAHIV